MASNLEIIVGTYEQFLLGYKLDTKADKAVLVQSFADKSHCGAIKCLAVQKKYIATGGTDDRIFLYDMSLRKQVQILLSHDGTVNTLTFTPDHTHLLSGSEDGKMIATRLQTWITEGLWHKAHNSKPVTHIACHPSSKLALTLGGDFSICTWNLIKGRVAYRKNLKSHGFFGNVLPDNLLWSPDGSNFSLTGQRSVDFWCTDTADLVRSHKTEQKPTSLCWIKDDLCLVGLENGKIIFKNIHLEEEEIIQAHDGRIKAMSYVNEYLASVCSNGIINLWHVDIEKQSLKKIASTNIGCRPTCIGLLNNEDFESVVEEQLEKFEDIEDNIEMDTTKTKITKQGKVIIEYENDDVTINESVRGDKKKDKKKQAKKKDKTSKLRRFIGSKKNKENEEDDDSFEEQQDITEVDTDECDAMDTDEEEFALFKSGSRKRHIKKR